MLTAAECHAHEDARNWAGQGVSVAIQVRLVHGLMAQHPQQKHTAVPVEGEKRKGPKATHGWAAGWTVMQRFQWQGRQADREELLARVHPSRALPVLPWWCR